MTRGQLSARVALSVLAVLTLINFLNYLDRYVLSAVLEQIRKELVLDDASSGLLGTMFMVVYMVFAPLGGYLGDRVNRHRMTAGAVALWSLATIAGGFAETYPQLLATRAMVGIGEAGYATVAPSIIADLFRPEQRGRYLAVFYLAIPMGSALGYLVGGYVGEHFGWRAAFYVAGTPGIVLAGIAAMLPDPPRGATEDHVVQGPRIGFLQGFQVLGRNVAWKYNTVGTTLMTFAMGGMAFWMPTYLVRVRGLSLGTASMVFGGVTVVAGLVATMTGGVLGDRAQARRGAGYLRFSGIALLMGAPFTLVMPFLPSITAVFVCAFAAEFFLFLNTGPLNAALVACVPAPMRASAVAINVLFIHLLGDAISPTVMGLLSDWQSLSIAIASTSVFIAAGGIVLVRGAARIERGGQNLGDWAAGRGE